MVISFEKKTIWVHVVWVIWKKINKFCKLYKNGDIFQKKKNPAGHCILNKWKIFSKKELKNKIFIYYFFFFQLSYFSFAFKDTPLLPLLTPVSLYH